MELCWRSCGSLDGRGELGGGWIHVHVWLSPFSVHPKLSQHCLLIGYTLIQNKHFFLKDVRHCECPSVLSIRPGVCGWLMPFFTWTWVTKLPTSVCPARPPLLSWPRLHPLALARRFSEPLLRGPLGRRLYSWLRCSSGLSPSLKSRVMACICRRWCDTGCSEGHQV